MICLVRLTGGVPSRPPVPQVLCSSAFQGCHRCMWGYISTKPFSCAASSFSNSARVFENTHGVFRKSHGVFFKTRWVFHKTHGVFLKSHAPFSGIRHPLFCIASLSFFTMQSYNLPFRHFPFRALSGAKRSQKVVKGRKRHYRALVGRLLPSLAVLDSLLIIGEPVSPKPAALEFFVIFFGIFIFISYLCPRLR